MDDEEPFSKKVKDLQNKLDKLKKEEADKKRIKQLNREIKEMENKKKPINKIIRGIKDIWNGNDY